MKTNFFIIFLLTSICALSQKEGGQANFRFCLFDDTYPPMSRSSVNNNIQASTRLINNNEIVYIPVVFHVLYNTPEQNISTTRLINQLNRLNVDFRRLNLSEYINIPPIWANLVADSKIEFKFACVDPNGNATNGINYFNLPSSANLLPDQISSIAPTWDRKKYLNIWVAPINAIGFATSPWTPTLYPTLTYDGVFMNNYAIIDNPSPPLIHVSQGKVLAHEVGHWLGLFHTFIGCGGSNWGDLVADTPDQSDDCWAQNPTFPKYDNCQIVFPGIMFMNNMGYAADQSRYMFSNGQADRMREFLLDGTILYNKSENLENYFGFGSNVIKNYFPNQCETFSIQISNPMCLPYQPTVLNGDVTIASYTTHSITLSVNPNASCTGDFKIQIASPSYNYISEEKFSYEIQNCNISLINSPTLTYIHVDPVTGGIVNNYIQNLEQNNCSTNKLCFSWWDEWFWDFSATSSATSGNVWSVRYVEEPGYTSNFFSLSSNGTFLTNTFIDYSTSANGFVSIMGVTPGVFNLEFRLTNTTLNFEKIIKVKGVFRPNKPSCANVFLSPANNFPHSVYFGNCNSVGYQYTWTNIASGMQILPNSPPGQNLGTCLEWSDANFNYGANPNPTANLEITNSFGCPTMNYIVSLKPSDCYQSYRTNSINSQNSNKLFKEKSDDLKRGKVNLSPNPSSNYIEIQTEDEIVEYSITSLNTKLEIKKNVYSKYKKVDISRLPKGLYIISIKLKDNSISYKKFIKV